MKTLIEKEISHITRPLKAYVEKTLCQDFKTKSGRSIGKVLNVQIGEININSEISEFKENIYINNIDLGANVHIIFTDGSFQKAIIQLSPTNIIHLHYDITNRQYNIVNGDRFTLIDNTPE